MDKYEKFANILFESEQSRVAIPPLTETDDTLTVDDAYRIQLLNVQRVCETFHFPITGKKIGLTSKGIQEQLGVDEPDYGHLFAPMDLSETCKVVTSQLLQPKIEGEVAFILKSDLSGGKVTPEDVRNATDFVVAAFEIVDSRVEDWRIKLVDTISDNASSGRYILGRKRVAIGDIDLPSVSMKFYKNGNLVGEGTGAAVLGDPAVSVAWLANRLWNYGVTLKSGEVILSGAFSAAPPAEKGDEFMADFGPLGTVTAQFI